MFDFVMGLLLLVMLVIPMLLIALGVRATSKGSALYWSDRVGCGNDNFRMPKFRTMMLDTPAVATHLMGNPDIHLSPIGGFLRQTSLDELPQLWCILKREMIFVGPRPEIFNQDDFIALRMGKEG